MIPADTSPEAHERQLDLYRRMAPADRVARAWRLSEEAFRVEEDGIRSRHRSYSAEEIRFAAIRRRLGDALFRNAYPAAPLLDP